MKEKMGIEPAGKSLKEKVAITREYRMKQYDSLVDAVFKRRGWTSDGCPIPEHLRKIGMDLPEVLAVAEARIAEGH
jgi:aldehyde:ferredoxin oxidoreductase